MRFTGKTVEEAKGNACLKLEKTLKELNIEVIFEGTKGFLGIGAKPAIIEVSVIGEEPEVKPEVKRTRNDERRHENEKKTTVKKAAKDVVKKTEEKPKEKKPRRKKEPEMKVAETSARRTETEEKSEKQQRPFTIGEKVDAYIRELTIKMGIETKTELTVDESERQVLVNIICDEPTLIIGKRGIVLDAVQTIINATFNKEKNGYWLKTDCDGYREKRAKTIENLAFRTAKTVKRNKRKVYLDRLSSAERRIIHSLLQHDEEIETFSEGREPNRKLVVYYKR
ncbi:MAG: RNA-binding cell elongation regulator Jag/EloR [Eubacteriales bacterium]|nr:RNA-binding cell elongation regulator Jag/EloR [Eubacteriales bacterium]